MSIGYANMVKMMIFFVNMLNVLGKFLNMERLKFLFGTKGCIIKICSQFIRDIALNKVESIERAAFLPFVQEGMPTA